MTFLRGIVTGWAGKIFLGLLLGIFAVAWTVADGFSGRLSPSTVMTVGGTSVSLQDYQIAYQQNLARVSQQIGRRPTPEEMQAFGIDQSTLSQLATGAVLDEQGRVLGLGLSEQGLLRLIAEDPSFQDASGNFSRNAFRTVLQNAGMTESAYIDRLGETALRTQIIDSVAEGVPAPETFSAAIGLYAGERRTVSLVTATARPADEIADPSDEELQTFFTAQEADYAAPEYRAFSYVDLTAEVLADPASVTDEALAADYEANRARFGTPERRQVRQIVFPDQAAAEAAAAEIAGGASFEDVAAAAGRSAADTDLGLLARSDIPDANIADAAFQLQAGETSGVVPGLFGPTILNVQAIEPEGVEPLEAVEAQLREELALDAAAQRVDEAYNVFEDARAAGATLEEAAQEAGLTVVQVPAIDATGLDAEGQPVENLPAQGELIAGVFETQPDFDNPPINYASNSYVFYDVSEITEARQRPLDEVRDEVVADWKAEEAGEELEERVEAMRARVEAGETLEAVAEAEGLTVETEPNLTRASATPRLGEAAANAAFSGPSGLVATAPGAEPGTWMLVRVDDVTAPADPLAEIQPQQTAQISGALQNDILQAYVAMLQAQYPVRFNEAAVQTAQSLR